MLLTPGGLPEFGWNRPHTARHDPGFRPKFDPFLFSGKLSRNPGFVLGFTPYLLVRSRVCIPILIRGILVCRGILSFLLVLCSLYDDTTFETSRYPNEHVRLKRSEVPVSLSNSYSLYDLGT